MALKAEISVDGKTIEIWEFNISVEQEISVTGKPVAQARGGQISLRVQSNDDAFFYKWAINNAKHYDGEITFYKVDNFESILKKIEFKDGYLVSYREAFERQNQNEMFEYITISAKEIKQDGATLINNWDRS